MVNRATSNFRFSIEIVRCRAVCPDWRDVGAPESPMRRPDTLVLGIPHLLLQFPPSNPADHPDCHLVQVRCYDPWVSIHTTGAMRLLSVII